MIFFRAMCDRSNDDPPKRREANEVTTLGLMLSVKLWLGIPRAGRIGLTASLFSRKKKCHVDLAEGTTAVVFNQA